MLIAALVLLSALAAAFALWQRAQAVRTLRCLDEMLTQAMDGAFTASCFDETRLSAVEARFARYLASSAVSARRVQAEREAVKALIGDIAHQTRTPLANTRLYAQLLAEQPLSAQGCVCAAALDAQTEKLQGLLEALVKTSRLETGVLALHPEPAAVAPVVERAAAQYLPKAAGKGVALTVEPPQQDMIAVLDVKWTEEALCNLLDNAVKYTPSGGSVAVCARAYEMFCRIDIVDTGCGIAEDEQARIFGRFYRSPSAAQVQGVGIGLYLTRQILACEGGYVRVASVPGRGSTFSVFLPRQAPDTQK